MKPKVEPRWNQPNMAKKNSGKSSAAPNESFEDSLEKLESISRELEAGKIGLSESLAKYEQGVKYLRHCYSLLESAEKKVQMLTGVDKDGNAITSDFDHEATTMEDADSSKTEKASKSEPNSKKNTKKAASKSPKSKDDLMDDSNSLF